MWVIIRPVETTRIVNKYYMFLNRVPKYGFKFCADWGVSFGARGDAGTIVTVQPEERRLVYLVQHLWKSLTTIAVHQSDVFTSLKSHARSLVKRL